MTQENKANENANEQTNGGDIKKDVRTGSEDGGKDGGELELLKKELESLKKEVSGRDSKINTLSKELSSYKTKEFENKDATEQLSEYKKLVERFEKREKYRTMFKDAGVDPDEFANILQENDEDKQIELFKAILERERKKSAEDTLTEFKKKELSKTTPPPKNTNGTTQDKNDAANNAIRTAFKK